MKAYDLKITIQPVTGKGKPVGDSAEITYAMPMHEEELTELVETSLVDDVTAAIRDFINN